MYVSMPRASSFAKVHTALQQNYTGQGGKTSTKCLVYQVNSFQ